ncbi:MAG TPA: ATP synthase F0 subunit B [Candidatus Absconditabacterales bacterium]|nr:ATP synthase F0 subunit B [Candidatus Absconditabacterales bacterium]
MDISVGAVLAQIINFLILFFLFKKFLTKPISKVIYERRSLIKKLENADKAYEEKIEIARMEAKEIVQDGIDRKDRLVAEAGILANNKKDEILKDAKMQADKILSDAENKAKSLENELEKNFIDGVKKTSLLVVKKLLQKDKDIKKEYLNEAVKEVTEK